MSLAQPGALWALLAVPLIVLLYVLRPTHRRVIVSTVRFWRQLPSNLEGQPRWRFPRTTWLLLAQLLTAGVLALALARPTWPGEVRQHLILLVDLSPSMLATDVRPTRLAAAVATARQLTAALGPDDRATLISIEPLPRLLGSGTGPRALADALARLDAASGTGDAALAIQLAAQTARAAPDSHNRIVILSDGTFEPVDLKQLGTIPAEVSYQQFGLGDENQAITALQARPQIGAPDRYLGFVQVSNFADQSATVGFSASVDGTALNRQALTIPARGHVEVSLPLPTGAQRLNVAIDAADDFALDNQAEVLVPGAPSVPVTLVAANPSVWQQALKTLPEVQLQSIAPTNYRPDNARITIFDGFLPSVLPAGNLVIAAPPVGNGWVPVNGELAPADLIDVDAGSSLFSSVDLAGLFLPHPLAFGAIPWARPIAETANGPVAFDGNLGQRRVVVLGFAPESTDWPQRISFPVFVANVVEALAPAAVPTSVAPGEVLDLPPFAGAKQVLVQLPSGEVDVFANAGAPIRFANTGQTGEYVVTATSDAGVVARDLFVVNRLSTDVSDIGPRVDAAQLTQTTGPPGTPARHDVWTWVAGGALALLGLEWALATR